MNPELAGGRDLVTQWVLETPEAERVRSLLPSTQDILELCETDASLQQRLVETGLSKMQVAKELFHREWLRATLDEATKGIEAPAPGELLAYYQRHADQWVVPEKRELHHILVTVQDGYPENTETAAKARIEGVIEALEAGAQFAEMARQVSECPTALDGGALGIIPRGKLFPELDEVAFALEVNQVSHAVRTEMGWHVLVCRNVEPSRYQSFEEVAPQLATLLLKHRRVAAQKRWVSRVTEMRRHAG